MISAQARERFLASGFLHVPRLLSPSVVQRVAERYQPLFRGEFETGIYPDEWHWREGISRQEATREICNAWKSDRTIAAVVLSAQLGRLAASLLGWPSTRVAQDSVIWKPPGASAVGFHTDAAYISENFEPKVDNSVTVWIALDDADQTTGMVEHAAGSHRWPRADPLELAEASFHSSADHRAPVQHAAAEAGVDLSVVLSELKVCAGDAVVHHQDTWHGSGPNLSSSRHRRALAVHLLRGDVAFASGDSLLGDQRPNYIYGRYKLLGDTGLREQFFPVTFSADGYRSPWIEAYALD